MGENRCVMCNEPIPEGTMVCYRCENEEPSFDTYKMTVSLNKISDIQDFVNLASKCPNDVIIKSGRFAVNAKSIMGLFSLDLSKPLKVEFYGRVPYAVKQDIKKFMVD